MTEKRKIIINIVEAFILNDIQTNSSSFWNQNTKVSSIVKDGALYVIRLKRDGKENGYLVVGNDNVIKEFGYFGDPLSLSLVSIDEEEKKRAYDKIDKTYIHVNDRYGLGWEYHSGKSIADFSPLNMSTFNFDNHCTLTSVTALFNYYRSKGFHRICSDIYELFNIISEIATKNGYYNKKRGTYPWYIDNLVRDVWDYFGYEGGANNDFFFWDTNSLNEILKKEIDEGRPGIISFTGGNYRMHTVTFYGYKIYKKEGFDHKMYLKVNDNWTTEPRFVDTTFIGDLGETFFELCRVVLSKE